MATGGGKQPTFRATRAQCGHNARCAPYITPEFWGADSLVRGSKQARVVEWSKKDAQCAPSALILPPNRNGASPYPQGKGQVHEEKSAQITPSFFFYQKGQFISAKGHCGPSSM